MKKFRIYILLAIPFMAVFGYEILGVLPTRPEVVDALHGFTIPLNLDDDRPPRYISKLDFAITIGSFLVAFLFVVIGMWRNGAFSRKKAR